MTFYLGKPALGLIALPSPLGGVVVNGDRAAVIHASSSGARTVDLAARSRRTFTLSWAWLSPTDFTVIEEFFTGARGPGPFVLLDPGRRNHLTTNQAGAGSQTNDATGFAVAPGSGEAVASAAIPVLRGPRALHWSLPGTVSSGVLELSPPGGLLGFPVPAGTPWTFSGSVSCAGLAPSVTVTPTLSWRRADGSELSTTSGTPVAATVGAWVAFSVSVSNVPAGALYVGVQLRVAPGLLFAGAAGTDMNDLTQQPGMRAQPGLTVLGGGPNRPIVSSGQPAPRWGLGAMAMERAPATSTDVVLDQLMLDMFASARTWVNGTGMPQVSLTALPESYRVLPDRSVSATVVEIS